jgi:uncharacterized protein (PEP-CTERM system associated)
LAGLIAALLIAPLPAAAFPFTDPTNSGVVPQGQPLEPADQHDLQRQMQLGAGMDSAGPGWTILPRLSVQGVFNDNVLQSETGRRWDVGTFVTPGVSVIGDLPRVQLRLNYDPTVQLYARTPSQNGLSQQLVGTGLITVVPDLFYIDARALAGVQATMGGPGGVGGLGSGGVGVPGVMTPSLVGTIGVPKNDRLQTFSFGASPYLVHRFGDWGTGKIGFSLDNTTSASVTGFAPSPFPADGQRATRTEEIAQFETGSAFLPWRNLTILDQTNTTGTQDSVRRTASNMLGYMVNRTVTVFGALGMEDIKYSGPVSLHTSGPTWAVGTTLTPSPDAQITVSYGHHDGVNGFGLSGDYAVTARTRVNARYSTGLSTDLEQIANQLQLGSVDTFGNLVDSQTGGPLFGGLNAIGQNPGVYRVETLTLGSTTVLDRDTVNVSFSWQRQTSTGMVNSPTVPASGSRFQAQTVSGSWLHQLSPVLGLSTAASYSYRQSPDQSGGDGSSLAATVALQYTFTETLTGTARYVFFNRSYSAPGQSMYQNLFLVGVTKQF